MPLTADQAREAVPGTRPYELHDTRGLVLRVYPSGRRSWRVQYWELGERRNPTIGQYPEMGLEQARAERDRLRLAAAKSEDMTVRAMAKVYLEQWARPNKTDGGRRDRWLLNRYVLEARVKAKGRRRAIRFGDRPMAHVTRAECAQVLHPIVARGTGPMAARAYACMRRLFNFAVEQGEIDANPAARMKIRQGKSRDRALSAHEIAAWWPLFAETVPPGPRIAAGLILATMQRPGEVLEFEIGEIDTIDRVWLLPGDKAKNRQPNVVPLSGWALSLIDEALSLWPDSDRVVAVSATTVRDWVKTARLAAGIDDRFTPHDLRRTGATWLGYLGYSRTVQDKILNHVDRSTSGIYDRYDYLDEKRAALEAWAARFHDILNRHPDHTHGGTRTQVRQGLAAGGTHHKG